MPAQWTGLLVGKKHNAGISNAELAGKLGVSEAWVSMVLRGKRSPEGAEQRFNDALDELISEKHLVDENIDHPSNVKQWQLGTPLF